MQRLLRSISNSHEDPYEGALLKAHVNKRSGSNWLPLFCVLTENSLLLYTNKGERKSSQIALFECATEIQEYKAAANTFVISNPRRRESTKNARTNLTLKGSLLPRRLILQTEPDVYQEWLSTMKRITTQKKESRVTQCPECLVRMVFKDLDFHRKTTCPMIEIVCKGTDSFEGCGAVIRKRELLNHCQLECPNRIVTCPFTLHGCTFKCSAVTLNQHLTQGINQHMLLLCTKVNDLTLELERERKLRHKLELSVFGDIQDTSHNTHNAATDLIRSLVSKKKVRYTEEGFDLDLTYITPRLIAMGFPSDGGEALFRNPATEVKKLLETKHHGHYRIYNLCIEKGKRYKHSFFFNRVEDEWCGFVDHNPCEFTTLVRIMEHMRGWLAEDPKNVCAVHCKAGKGRTGLVLASFLMYSKMFATADEALLYYGNIRTANGQGVTIPSQIRYTGYIEAFLSETKGGNLEFREVENSGGIREAEKDNMIVTSAVYRSKARSGIRDENKESLLELVWVPQDMDLSPRSSPAQLLHFKQNSPTLYFTHMRVCHYGEVVDKVKLHCYLSDRVYKLENTIHTPFIQIEEPIRVSALTCETSDIPIQGDVMFSVRKSSKRTFSTEEEHFSFWLNSNFVNSTRPNGDQNSRYLLLQKPEIDKIGKDQSNKLCPEGTYIELFFDMRPYHKRPLNERVEKYNPVLNDKKVSFLETILENKAFEVCLRDLKKRAIILSSHETKGVSTRDVKFLSAYYDFKHALKQPNANVRILANSLFITFFRESAPLAMSVPDAVLRRIRAQIQARLVPRDIFDEVYLEVFDRAHSLTKQCCTDLLATNFRILLDQEAHGGESSDFTDNHININNSIIKKETEKRPELPSSSIRNSRLAMLSELTAKTRKSLFIKREI